MVSLDLTERVAWITLDRPPLNILNVALLEELDAALLEVGKNRDAAVVVISGAGEAAFSAGLDVAERVPDAVARLLARFHQVARRLAHQPQATLAAIDGLALGGALELANLCDIAVASDRSRLGYPQIHLACFPTVALVTLPTTGGRPAGTDLVLSGQTVEAAAARSIGLVSRVFPIAEYDERLRALVAGLAAKSPAVLRLVALELRNRWLAGFDAALEAAEATYLRELQRLPDTVEGVNAFLEKRAPRWS
jgi:cyclohexa-1,5-dienecarbonyl-CoA hydratase